MIPAPLLQATLDLSSDVENTARPADAVTSAFFRARRHFGDKDRGAILELVYDLLRHRARLGWWLNRLGNSGTPRNRLVAWLVLTEAKTPEQMQRLFNGARFAPAALTDREAALAAALQGGTLDHPDMPEEVRLEVPHWAVAPLRRRFGAAFGAEMAATLAPPSLDLRVNQLKTTRAAVLQGLKELGLDAAATKFAPQGIRLPERLSLARLPWLKTGEVEIQDEGSQLVAALLDAQPGDRVVDFCAGAGGKTLAIASQMNNRGRIVACDVNEARVKRCAERLRNAGVHNTEVRVLASESDRWVKRHKASFDRVLIDAPCSGTGTWRRNPDARWRETGEEGLANLVALQARILASAARLVRPGGRLVYATCSLLPEENEDQVSAFLAANPAFRLAPLGEAAPELAEALGSDTLSLTPARHDTDGFFAAVLERAAPVAPPPEGKA